MIHATVKQVLRILQSSVVISIFASTSALDLSQLLAHDVMKLVRGTQNVLAKPRSAHLCRMQMGQIALSWATHAIPAVSRCVHAKSRTIGEVGASVNENQPRHCTALPTLAIASPMAVAISHVETSIFVTTLVLGHTLRVLHATLATTHQVYVRVNQAPVHNDRIIVVSLITMEPRAPTVVLKTAFVKTNSVYGQIQNVSTCLSVQSVHLIVKTRFALVRLKALLKMDLACYIAHPTHVR